MKRAIWIPCLLLAFAAIAWAVSVSVAGSNLDSGTAAARYSSENGLCRIEVVYGDPFTLIVSGSEGEKRTPSSLDALLRHSVEVVTESAFKLGWTSNWSQQIAGAEYQVASAADDLRIRIEPIDR